MADEKSLPEKVEGKVKDIGKKVEEVLDDIAADETPVKAIYSDDEQPSEPSKT